MRDAYPAFTPSGSLAGRPEAAGLFFQQARRFKE
jgi:hypothetical protein